ncbi:unnamed protein product, partial [Musa banksii]
GTLREVRVVSGLPAATSTERLEILDDERHVVKHFVKSCDVVVGDGEVGTLREVRVVSGLPAATSTERLEILDDERHVLGFRVRTSAAVGTNQCCSAVVQTVTAPVAAVWAVVRRFDRPQAYKHFVKSCDVVVGDGEVGTLREVRVVSGLPAATSTERLEILDGEHRLANYRSVTTLHPDDDGGGRTVVVESYVVDVPPGNTTEETRVFVDTIVKCNLRSLARIAGSLQVRRRRATRN